MRRHVAEKQGGDGIILTPVERLFQAMDELDIHLDSALSQSNHFRQLKPQFKQGKGHLYHVNGRFSKTQYAKLRSEAKPALDVSWAMVEVELKRAKVKDRSNVLPVFMPVQEGREGWEPPQRIGV